MDWVLDHLQVLFVIAVAVVAVLQKLKQARFGEAAGGPPAVDPAQAERTRRIQEEIRRRIMERRGLSPTPRPEPEAEEEPPALPVPPPLIAAMQPVMVSPPLEQAMKAPAQEAVSESSRQQQIVQQFREAQAALAAGRDSSPLSGAEPAMPASGGSRRASPLLAELRSPAGFRRAVVLREILGPPVGLR